MHAAALLLTLTLAVPSSKLGAFIRVPDTADARKVLAACPPVAVFTLPDSWALAAISSLTSSCLDSEVVVRVTFSKQYTFADDPEQSANDYWNRIAGSFQGLVSPRAVWLEAPLPGVTIPDWTGDATGAAWAAKFFASFADHASSAGYLPLVGAMPSGTPRLAGETGAGSENLFAPTAAAMKAKKYVWGWSYQAFSSDLSHSSADEADGTLRYRRIRTECGLEGIPVVITQAGQAGPGWLARGTPATTYLEWLDWFDARLREDADVRGAALYYFGRTTTVPADFDLSAITDGIVALVNAPSRDAGVDAPPPAASDAAVLESDASVAGGMDARSGGGIKPPPGGSGTPAPEETGCTCSGAGTGTGLAALAAYLFRRRRTGRRS